jgi:hypothetical protein
MIRSNAGRFVLLALALLVIICVGGCKKEVPAPSSASTATDAATQAVAEATPDPAAAPVIIDTQNLADTKAAMEASQAALKAKQYEDATKALLLAQQRQLTEQQSKELYRQMIQLQRSVSEGVANGDPRAQAAAEMLREAHSHH